MTRIVDEIQSTIQREGRKKRNIRYSGCSLSIVNNIMSRFPRSNRLPGLFRKNLLLPGSTTASRKNSHLSLSASAGNSSSYTNRIFVWMPPDVTVPTLVSINVTVTCLTCNGCSGSNGIRLMVNPRPIGQISLEKLFDGDPNNVKLGDIVSYTININNTGQTNATFLPLVDNYPSVSSII